MWHFRVMGRGEINQDPTQEDYFNTDHLTNFSDALVREAIQNSLDARMKGSGSVTVRITFPSGADILRRRDVELFFDRLDKHIGASEVITDPPDPDDLVSFIVFEDFGTKGLIGDPLAADDPAAGEPADFYYFWRNIGRGKKQGEELGRWGLGKTMFPASSRIHSFFGLTLRHDDRRKLLMGQSMLSIHRLDGHKHYPYGYFGLPDGADGFVVPFEDGELIDDFSLAFSLTRQDESGLSVVIPYPRDEITAEDVIRSTIHHYFYPVLSGKLTIEVAHHGVVTTIAADSIDGVLTEFPLEGAESFHGTLALTKWFLSQSADEIPLAKVQAAGRKPEWNENLFTASQLDAFAEKLDSRQPLAVRVPVHVTKAGNQPVLSSFVLVMQRDPELERPLDSFIRSGITVSGVHSLRESGLRALVIAEDQPLVAMLGDAENPAHTEWQDRSRNFVGKYRTGKSTLSFVKDAPRGFLRILNRRSEHIDDTALRHVFPDESTLAPRPPEPGAQSTPDPTRAPRPRVDVTPRPKLFQLTRADGGFSVRLAQHGKTEVPMTVRVRLAYDVRRGSPYKRWVAADFDLTATPDRILLDAGDLLDLTGNTISVLAKREDFLLKVSGFDPSRDLIVDLRREDRDDAP